MPQQTKTEALEELARLIRRDILNGEAPLNGVWWFDDDTRMQDRIAHVLLDYSDEEKPTELDKVSYNSRLDVYLAEIQRLTEKCAALVVERDRIKAQFAEAFGEQRERAIDKMTKPLVDHAQEMMKRGISPELARVGAAFLGAVDKAPTLRIDTDMSNPQPGKLLVVRLDADDVGRGWVELGDLTENGRGKDTQNFWPSQRVGFLVETPAAEVKRTPKVGDKVRFTIGSRHKLVKGIVVSADGEYATVDYRGALWSVAIADLEVIE